MATWEIEHADILDWARTYDGPPFHALLCDAPYGLEFMSMSWDSFATPKGSAQARVMRNKAAAFYDFTVAWAEAVKAHLHPGAFMMIFGGSRTYHRMACAIEDAGLIIHPAISWVYGSGFPKSTRVKGSKEFEGHRYGRQVLKPASEFICVAQKPYIGKPVECITTTGAGALWIDGGRIEGPMDGKWGGLQRNCGIGYNGNVPTGFRTKQHPAGRWPANLCLDEVLVNVCRLMYNTPNDVQDVIRGYYDGYSRVPELREACCNISEPRQPHTVLQPDLLRGMAQQEQPGRDPRDVRQASHGRGAAQDESCGSGVCENGSEQPQLEGRAVQGQGLCDGCSAVSAAGRADQVCVNGVSEQWEVHSRASTGDGSPTGQAAGAEGSCTSSERGQGRQPTGEPRVETAERAHGCILAVGGRGAVVAERERATEGATLEVLECDIPLAWLKYFEPTERTVRHPECAAAVLDAQAGERKSGYMKPRQMRKSSKGDGGYQGSFPDEASAQGTYGDTGGASRFFFVAQADQIDGADPFRYCAKASRRERDAGLRGGPLPIRNVHPTVKPLALLRWLATLLLPPAEYAPRRILVPFAGSGSECIAAGLAGWDEIVGVEREADYVEIAKARLTHWLAQRQLPLLASG